MDVAALYFLFASLSYFFFFMMFKEKFHPSSGPQPKPGQVFREIKLALWSMPVMSIMTAPLMVLEVNGYSKLYEEVDSWVYMVFSAALFLVFTDTCIYWIHRWEHEIPFLYQYVHKPHHAWYIPTPFAAIAFHPVDGWLQALPYHIFVFIFPFQKLLYIAMFIFVQLWTISIHDGVDANPGGFINGTAHHNLHHSQFVCNYGQFFTFWDIVGGTHKDPVEYEKSKSAQKSMAPEELEKLLLKKNAKKGKN